MDSYRLYGNQIWPIKWKTVSSRQRSSRYYCMDALLGRQQNKSWRQHPARHQLYSHLPPITKTIQARRTRHAGHCWRRRDELISDVLLWTPIYGRAKAGQTSQTYIQQLSEDTGCRPEDLPEAMTIGGSGERGSGISVLAARHDDDDDVTKLNLILGL